MRLNMAVSYDIQWITPSEIANYEFCPADEEMQDKIQQVTA